MSFYIQTAYSKLPRSPSYPGSHSHPSPPSDSHTPPFIYSLFAASVALLDGMTDPISPEALRQLYAEQIVLLSEIYKSTIPPIGVFPDGMEMQQDQYANPSGGSGYGSSEQSESGKSPLSMSLGFLKTLTEKKSTRGEPNDKIMYTSAKSTLVDGQPSKRRGPKPDSKPALTRRQELNRQAQRHDPSRPRPHPANRP